MDTLQSDLFLKIAQSAPHPELVLCSMRCLNKKIHQLISPLSQTTFVVRVLLKKPHSIKEGEVLQLVLDECTRKIQAQRQAVDLNLHLADVALTSVTLEQHLIKQLMEEKKVLKVNSRRIVSRMPIDRPVRREPKIKSLNLEETTTSAPASSSSLKSTIMGFFSGSPKP